MDTLINFSTAGNFTIGHIVFNLILTLVLVVLIAWVYRMTHRGLSYSQNFISTIILMSMITTVIMMVIGNNLAVAFGLLGAFAIIRFRTVVKETRDTGFIFFALAIGMAVGTNNHMIAAVSTVVLLAVIWVLFKFRFGSMQGNDYLLTFTVDADKNPPDSFVGIFEKYLKNSMLLNINAKSDGHSSEMVYSIRFVDETKSRDLVEELSRISGVERVHVVSSKSDIEY
jgi:uncharacterized membrane protein YhiD involved in acid resistance|tara:strand:+ start:26753 stop:27433 length:681 start_codon:yes stop_codon:yes gene_type:complete